MPLKREPDMDIINSAKKNIMWSIFICFIGLTFVSVLIEW